MVLALDLPLPWMITQQSSLELCFAISSPVSFTACVLLLSWFIVAKRTRSNGVARGSRLPMLYRCAVYPGNRCYSSTDAGALQENSEDGKRLSISQTTSNGRKDKYKSPTFSRADHRSRCIQPAWHVRERPRTLVFKSRGCHASPLFTPKLYLHNRCFSE